MLDMNYSNEKVERETIVFYFKDNHVMVTNLLIIIVGFVFAGKNYLNEQTNVAVGIALFAVAWAIIRYFLVANSPKSISLNLAEKKLIVSPRPNFGKPKIIEIGNLYSVNLSKTIARFPIAILKLTFDNQSDQVIKFNLENSNKGFLKTPEEVMPDSVSKLFNMLDQHLKLRKA